ncbi:hypothetical protein BDR07DRAFT_1486452 [Suillus spraguei]|nr:hypothetical protein BDR07DRAFT_1486452 [Suillus spraguei]
MSLRSPPLPLPLRLPLHFDFDFRFHFHFPHRPPLLSIPYNPKFRSALLFHPLVALKQFVLSRTSLAHLTLPLHFPRTLPSHFPRTSLAHFPRTLPSHFPAF